MLALSQHVWESVTRRSSFPVVPAQIETPLFTSSVPGAVKAIDGRKAYFLEKRRKVKENEPVEDAEWEKQAPTRANGSTSKAAKQEGLTDINDWPGPPAETRHTSAC